jgi:hypothetical protein
MWYVCYDLNGETHYNAFENEEEARKCFEEDKEYYSQFEIGVVKVSIAKVTEIETYSSSDD